MGELAVREELRRSTYCVRRTVVAVVSVLCVVDRKSPLAPSNLMRLVLA